MPKNLKPNLDKFAIAAALQEIAALMDLKGGKYRFKAKAYNAGARSLQAVANLDQLIKEDRLTSLPRIGEALASQIKELYLTGESSVLKGLKEEFPDGNPPAPGGAKLKLKVASVEDVAKLAPGEATVSGVANSLGRITSVGTGAPFGRRQSLRVFQVCQYIVDWKPSKS